MKQGNGWLRSHRFWRVFDGLAVKDLVAGTPHWRGAYQCPWAEHGPGLKCFRLGAAMVVSTLEDFGRKEAMQIATLPPAPYSRS